MKPYWQHFTRKYVSIVIFISLFFLVTNILIGVATKPRLRLVYVEEISLKEKPYKGEQTEIYIIGYKLALWEFYSHKIDIDDDERKVKIKLWVIIKKIRNTQGYTPPAAILPYIYSINIIFPFSGVWAIECNNKNISVIVYS